jgi:HK97 family phage major capsid protein
MREIKPELDRLADMPGKLSGPQRARWNELSTEYAELEDICDERQAQLARSKNAANVKFGVATPSRLSGDEFRDVALRNIESSRFIEDGSKERATTVVETSRLDPASSGVARYAALASDETYCRAFAKYLAGPLDCQLRWTPEEHKAWVRTNDEYRTWIAGSGGSGGGYLTPLYLDPTFVITGAGARNPFRQVSQIKTITTLTYNGATGAQVTAGLLSENAAYSDNTPTVSQVQIATYKIGAYIPASFEAFEDIVALAADVAEAFADAKLNYEATQFATGTGSAPHGVVADVGAVTASRVSPATGGAFAIADLYSVHGGLPPRYRNSDPAQRAWMGSVNTIDKMRQFATSSNYATFLTDLAGGQPPRLLGDQLYEASAMSSSYTTGQDILLFGDFSRFYIVDRLDLSIEFIPNVFDQSTGRPSGTRAWLCHWRVGSATADTGGFRLLRL